MDEGVTERFPSLQTLPALRTLEVLQSIGMGTQNPKPPSPVQEGTVSKYPNIKTLRFFAA